jgi:carbonic anhydrase
MNNTQIINISRQSIEGTCNNKCSFEYKYLTTELIAQRKYNMIQILSNDIDPVVKYNNYTYYVSSIFITSPSLHKFNNKRTTGELFIEHMPIQGGKKLYVCVPIVKAPSYTESGALISVIIESLYDSTNDSVKEISVGDNGYNIQTFIPQNVFYTYTGNDLYNEQADFIVFGYESAISISNSVNKKLSQMLEPISIKMTGNGLFLNEKGPIKLTNINYQSKNKNSSTNKNTNIENESSMNSDEETNKISSDFISDIFKNKTMSWVMKLIFSFIFYLILLTIIWYILNYSSNYMADKSFIINMKYK